MRTRMGLRKLPLALCASGALVISTATAVHGQSGGANGGEGGAHNTPGGAEAIASYTSAKQPGPSGTGSGSTKQYDCYYQTVSRENLDVPGGGDRLTEAELQDIFDARGREEGDTMEVRLRCDDPDTGEPVFDEAVDWPDETAEDVIDPAALAEDARNAIVLPVPQVETSPPIEAGTYATLPTYLGITNWEQTLTAEAIAGPVEVVVTATPVDQHWTFHDRHRGTTESVECAGSGSADAESGDCIWEPSHSSDGQPGGNEWQDEATGEPCFYSTVTVEWQYTWTLGGAEQGTLEPGFVAGSTCLVVAEVQAVVDSR